MISANRSATFDSSVASSQVSDVTADDNMETTKLKRFAKDVLKSRIFLGRYVERRLTNKRIGYRDIVVLSPAETELRKDLIHLQSSLRTVLPQDHWIGITDGEVLGSPSNVCIWTEIDNQPFGPFWFQIRSVKFREEEVIVGLKCVRHISESFLELEPILTGTAKATKSMDCISNVDRSKGDSNVESVSETFNEFIATLKGALTIRNIKDFVTFLFALVIAVFTGSSALINFLGNFVLALLREISIFVKNSTPMFLGFLDFLSKIVGGFYILMAMVFKPSNPAPQNRRAVTYDREPHRHSNTYYDDRSFD